MNQLLITTAPSLSDSSFTVFHLAGSLDARTVHDLEKRYLEETALGRNKWIVDLSGIEYLASAGLGFFIGVISTLRAAGGDICFVRPSSKVEKILKVIGFNRIFRVFEDESGALLNMGVVQEGGIQDFLPSDSSASQFFDREAP